MQTFGEQMDLALSETTGMAPCCIHHHTTSADQVALLVALGARVTCTCTKLVIRQEPSGEFLVWASIIAFGTSEPLYSSGFPDAFRAAKDWRSLITNSFCDCNRDAARHAEHHARMLEPGARTHVISHGWPLTRAAAFATRS